MFTILAEPSRIKTKDYDLPATPMALHGAADFLVQCEDGTTLSVIHLQARDVLTAIAEDSLIAHCLKLKQTSPWAYLIISGTLTPNKAGLVTDGDATTTRWRWDSLQGALLSVQEIGVAILYVSTASELPAALERLGKRKRSDERVRPVRDALFVGPGDDLLYALPGVGEATLGKLLATCKTPAWVLVGLSNPAFEMPGFGDSTLKNLRKGARETLGLQSNEQLTIDVVEV